LDDDADQCTSGLNYRTLRSRRETLEDYRLVLDSIYHPAAYFARVSGMARQLDLSMNRIRRPLGGLLRDLRSSARIQWKSGVVDRETRGPYWKALADCVLHNPRAVRTVFSMAALYLHLRPFSSFLNDRISGQIRLLEEDDASVVFGIPDPIAPAAVAP
jgi:hypothetical protein